MTTDLVPAAQTAITAPPSPLEWQALREMCDVIALSKLAPNSIDTVEKVITIALKGRELRVPPMQALSEIHIIEGKPTLSAQLMTSLVRRAGHKIRILESSADLCKVQGVRADDPDYPLTVTWTMQMAEAAQVTGKGNWKKHPDAMLIARATSALCRALFSDVLMGASYTPEELGADIDPDTGEVLTVEVENAYRDPKLTAVLDRVEELLATAADAGVTVDAEKAREHATVSITWAEQVVRNIEKRLDLAVPSADPQPPVDPEPDVEADVVDAELVDDEPAVGEPAPDPGWDTDTGEITGDVEPAPDPAYDWRDDSAAHNIKITQLLTIIRDGWPDNSQWNKPNRSKDLDDLAGDPDMAKLIAATIADIAGGR